jgi:hypothetical protein
VSSLFPDVLDNFPVDHSTASPARLVGPDVDTHSDALNRMQGAGMYKVAEEQLPANAQSFAEVVLPAGVKRVFGQLYVATTTAGAARLRLGGTSIDTGTNYATQSFVATSVTATSSTGYTGMALQHAALAAGSHVWVSFWLTKVAAAVPARLHWHACVGSIVAGTAPNLHHGVGIWANTTAPLERLIVANFSTITGTLAVNFGANSELVIYASR